VGRRRRSPADYARRAPVREPYDYVLIVCEGAKTEPNYFQGLKVTHRLSSANIKVMPADGTDPMSIVRFAIEEIARTPEYNKVYCVFDRNGHANYDQALDLVARSPLGRAGQLVAITSWPCFEIWLLLHYEYTTAEFVATGTRSACEEVIRRLKRHYPDYDKRRAEVFSETAQHLPTAMRNARQLFRFNQQNDVTNPGTGVHTLVEYLTTLKDQ
jgi:hypothetical protein